MMMRPFLPRLLRQNLVSVIGLTFDYVRYEGAAEALVTGTRRVNFIISASRMRQPFGTSTDVQVRASSTVNPPGRIHRLRRA